MTEATPITTPTPPRKKAVNGKAKGSGFENTIAKLLSEKFKPLEFRRSQSSGAILGGKNENLLHKFSDHAKALFIGDVVPTNEADVARDEKWRFRFTIECKFYKDVDTLNQLFKSPQVTAWYEQARTDASKIPDKLPLLIFKFNHTHTFCATDAELTEPPANCTTVLRMWYNVKGTTERRSIYIMLLDEVLQDLSWLKVSLLKPEEWLEGISKSPFGEQPFGDPFGPLTVTTPIIKDMS
jgi:hypothetical protein